MDITISVVMPVFNKEKYVAEAIDSVLKQSCKTFELMIVNDGSTDDSMACVSSVKDARVRVINQQNGGVSAARNTGILNATSEWIAFLDADDWWHEKFLEEITTAISRHPQNKVFATGRSRVFKGMIERYSNSLLPADGSTGTVDYLKVISRYLPPVNSSNVVLRKSALLDAGLFKIGQKQYEDHDLWLRVCMKEMVVLVNKNLSFYRKVDQQSASNNYYRANDFLTYLKTIETVKSELKAPRRLYFAKYYNRFILLVFIKNYKLYSGSELNTVFSTCVSIVDIPYVVGLYIAKFFPGRGAYSFLKYFYKG